jgi:hypothetical protein
VSTVELVEAEALTVDIRVELLDENETFKEDVTANIEPVGSSITHGIYRTIHGTATVVTDRRFVWGRDRLRITMLLTDGLGNTSEFPLGVWLMRTPEVTPDGPFVVSCYDKLHLLAKVMPATFYGIFADTYISTLGTLLAGSGESNILIDPSSTATFPTGRAWLITEEFTRLGIAGDLTTAINYRATYADRQGFYRADPYVEPDGIAPTWVYDATSPTTTLGLQRSSIEDEFDVPNLWVFIQNDPLYDLPTEGAGIHTVQNQSDGPTSIDGRGGEIIVRRVPLDVATQDELVARGNAIALEDRQTAAEYKAKAGPNPSFWHFDTALVTDPGMGFNAQKMLVTEWTLPFDGSDMDLTMREV